MSSNQLVGIEGCPINRRGTGILARLRVAPV